MACGNRTLVLFDTACLDDTNDCALLQKDKGWRANNVDVQNLHIAFCKPYFGYCFALPKEYLVTQTCPLPMQGAIFLQKFEEIATFEQKKCLAVY